MSELPRENAENLRQLEVARLDELLLAWWQRAKKDVQAANFVLRVGERRSRLLGLDVEPQAVESSRVIIREVAMGYLGLTEAEKPQEQEQPS